MPKNTHNAQEAIKRTHCHNCAYDDLVTLGFSKRLGEVPAEKVRLCDVSQLIVIKSLDVVLLHQRIDILLDIRDLRRESVLDLGDDFFDEVNVLELLATFHDTNNNGLVELVSESGSRIAGIVHTWSNNFLSSSIVL